ncbi:MAG: polysaccharide deacetylase family protein [Nocardiaceae bacterium]|nr:polysaccharide deacetylase family protein [Nocardiaceae bacterium]
MSTTTQPTEPPPTTTERPSRPDLYGADWERIPVSQRVVALTFDAGANDDGVASILSTLAREQVPATFFLTGSFVDSFPASARAMASHRLGNHSVSHPHFTELSDAQIRTEVEGAAARIRAVTGADPAPWFRFPFGDRNSHTIDVVNSLGFVSIRWTVDTLGWKGTSGGQSVSTVQQRVVNTLTNGQIVLMHVGSNPDDGSTLDADALPGIIAQLRGHGYSFVTLDALFG